MSTALFNDGDRYQLISEIGRGGMGVVYKATDKQLQRMVAVKQLLGTHDVKDFERLEREAKAVAQLQHKNIVHVHDIGQSNGQPYMVFEYVEGVTFDVMLEQGHYELFEIVEYLCKILEGVVHAHKKGVVHRDIKPSNILVASEDGEPKLLDFGLARLDSKKHDLKGGTLTEEGSVLGSVRYMSPEQANGERADEKADVWALGAILYESLTGHPIFPQEASFYNSIVKIIKEPVVAPILRNPDCPKALNRICLKALEKDKNERFQSAAELKDALEAWLENPSEKRAGALPYVLVLSLLFLLLGVLGATDFIGQKPKTKDPLAKGEGSKQAPPTKILPEKLPPKNAPPKQTAPEKMPAEKRRPAAFQGRIKTLFPWVSPVFFDANGDGCDDIITVVKKIRKSDDQGYITAFDGHSGRMLWQDSSLVSVWGRPCLYKDGEVWRIAAAGIHKRKLRMFLINATTGKKYQEKFIDIPPELLGTEKVAKPLSVVTWEMGPQRHRLFACYRIGTRETAEPSRIYFWNKSRRQSLVVATDHFPTNSKVLKETGRNIVPWWSKSAQRHIGFLWVCNGVLIGVKMDNIDSKSSIQLAWKNPPLSSEHLDSDWQRLARAYFSPDPRDPTRLLVTWYAHHQLPTVLQYISNTGKVFWTRSFRSALPNGDNPCWLPLDNQGRFFIGVFDRGHERSGGESRVLILDPETGETKKDRRFPGWLSSAKSWGGAGLKFLAVSTSLKAARLLRLDNFEERLVFDREKGDAISKLAVHDLDKDGRPELIMYRSKKNRLNSIEIVTPKIP